MDVLLFVLETRFGVRGPLETLASSRPRKREARCEIESWLAPPVVPCAHALAQGHEVFLSGMDAVALSRVGLRRVESPSGRGIAPRAGDAPRARGVRARGGAPRGVREEGDVLDVRDGSPGKNDPANVGSVRCESHDSASDLETHSDTVVRARCVALDVPPPESWIRVVVDSVLLDDAPFEPPQDAASARASENFRAAGGETGETVRVLTAVLRTVTDGRDRLLPVVASASLECAERAVAIEPETDATRLESTTSRHDAEARCGANRRANDDERPARSVPEATRRPYVFDAPPRAPRPTSSDFVRFGDDDRSLSSRARLASRWWPPAPAHPRRDPLGMCFEYLNNCMRPEKKKKETDTNASSDVSSLDVAADAAAFTAYGGDRTGAGMHQDVDFDSDHLESRESRESRGRADPTRDSPSRSRSLGPASRALETVRRHLETCAAEDTLALEDIDGVSFADFADSADSPNSASLRERPGRGVVEPRDVDDMLDALEDRVETAYLVVDAPGTKTTRRGERGRCVSASARLGATLYATPRDAEGAFGDSETLTREVRFETTAWLGPRDGPDGDVRATTRFSESRIVSLESFLALCAASRLNLPMYVSRDVADLAGVAPEAWRPSFRSVRRMGDAPEKGSGLIAPRDRGAGDGPTSRTTRLDSDPEDASAIGATFESFLRGVAASVADANASPGPETPRLQSLIEKNARGVPPAPSDGIGSGPDLREALLGGPAVFFRAALRAWADWYRKSRQSRAGASSVDETLAGEGFASHRDGGASSPLFGERALKRAGPPPRSDDALRRLTGKRGDLATNALIRSHGRVGHVTALDRRSLDCVVAHRMSIAVAATRRRYLSRAAESSVPKHVAAATLMLDSDEAFSFRDADPDAKTLVASWARRVARGASDAVSHAEDARALDETVAARAAEVDALCRVRLRFAENRRAGSSMRASPGRAIAELERAVSEERWVDAALWRDALHRVNERCVDHEAVFGVRAELSENGTGW